MTENKTSKAQIEANKRWNKKNKDKFKRYYLSFKKDEDKEIIDLLDSQENKNLFIKELLEKELKK